MWQSTLPFKWYVVKKLALLSCLSLILFSFTYPWTTLEPTTGKKVIFKSQYLLFFVSSSLGSYTSPAIFLKTFQITFLHVSSPLHVPASLLTTKEIWCKAHLTTDCKWTSWIWEKKTEMFVSAAWVYGKYIIPY